MSENRAKPRYSGVTRHLAKGSIASAVAIGLVIAGAPVSAPLAAEAVQNAGETLGISLSAKTGTPDFDSTSGPGKDTSAADLVIRTNDLIEYSISVVANGGTAEKPVVTLTLPQGQEVRDVPAWCDDESGADAKPNPLLPAPAVPLTNTSWQSLPAQTLTCHIPDMASNATQVLTVPVWQRSEVPNGTKVPTAVATIKSQAAPNPVSSTENLSMTISAAPKWDVRKNGIGIEENKGYSYQNFRACSWDTSRKCHLRSYSILVGAAAGGKGLAPFTGDVTFQDDLTPEKFFGADVVNSAAWKAAGADAVNKYAPRLVGCETRPRFHMSPGNNTGDLTESVRNSGAVSCVQPELGKPATVTISNADWSLYTYPDKVSAPAARPVIPDNAAYAVSSIINVEVPVDAITDLGVKVNTTTSLKIRNEFTNLQGNGLDGTPQQAGADPLGNNYLEATPVVSAPGGFTKFYGGVGGAEGNVPAAQFMPGDSQVDGPPGSTVRRSGHNVAGPGQTVTSVLLLVGSGIANSAPGQALLCDAWDNNKLHLHAGNWGKGSRSGQKFPSNGKAVWLSGSTYIDKDPTYTVEYSGDSTTAGGGAGSTCKDGTWYDDPAKVPGNDQELAKQGIYTGVSHVRIYTSIEEPTATAQSLVYQFYSIALRVKPGQQSGDILPNWASAVYRYNAKPTKDELLALNNPGSFYNPENHSGSNGDRMLYSPAFIRVSKQVSVKGGNFASSGVASPGDKVTWKVSPILSSAAVAEDVLKQPVYVEDCLPAGVIFDSASVNPAIAQPAPAPVGAEIKCDSGTYLRFNLGERKPNAALEPMEINTHVSAVAGSGTYRNTVVTQTDPLDPSPVDQRTAAAQITVSQIAGIKLEKQALTPVVQVNPEGGQQKQQNVWQLDFINLNAPNSVSEADVIDVLPTKTGVNGSKFAGTMSFERVDLLAGNNVTILYTKADKVESSPTAASNGDSGIAWCSAPAGGTPVKGTGACPSSAAEVTGLRFTRPGVFGNQDQISAKITMVAEGNKDGDLYVNRTEARATGLMFNVGPVDSRELANAASIGDKVWIDANGNGQQDSGEKPLAKFPVKLTGTDDLGNQVSLNTETNKDGEYSFAGLRSGTYTVTFDPAGLKTGMAFTAKQAVGNTAADSDGDPASGATDPIVLGVAQQRTDIDQGVTYNTARIGDTVWLDKNGNGLQDNGEDGVDGFKVKLTGTDIFGEPVELETTTANGGKYGFEGLVPGNYRVTFDPTSLPAGHSFVAKGNGQNSDRDSDGDQATGETTAFDLASGQVINNIDQGIAANPGSIGDYVWLDKNFDGVQNDTDEPLPNVRVILTGTDDYGNQVQKETKTSDQGRYLFDGLLPGKYVVTFDKSTLPDGHEFVAKGQGDNAETDSDADPQTGKTAELTLAAGAQLLGVDQGVSVKRGEVGDLFWNDENYNGVYDEGVDFGVRANGEIKLIGVDVYGNQVELTTNTDGVGKYLFTNVVPGKYRVQFPDYSSHPQSYMVAKGVGDNPRVDSDADPKTGLTDEFTLAPGEKNHTIDAGVADKRGSIGDRVWIDVNENGVQDDGEPGVAGVKVKLRGVVNRTSEVVELETETNDKGLYLFKDLREGVYSVTFDKSTLPAGYDPVEKQVGGDGAVDSDADPQTGKTAEEYLSFGAENLHLDMGIKVRKATVGDYVWFDKNFNGVQDSGEDPVPNFKVTLTGTDIYGRDVVVETTTNDEGKYLFAGVIPGNYVVTFDPASIPAGYRFAPKHQGDDRDADSDGDPATGATTQFTLAPEQSYLRVDQGLQLLLGSIGDRVWIDKNGDGVQDDGEGPAANVRVTLTGTDIYGNAVTRETETDKNGNYLFAGVVPGKYVVTFDKSTLSAGYEFVALGRGDDREKDSDGDAQTGATAEFELAAGEAKTDIDQGVQLKRGKIGDRVWLDANGNGVQDDGEKPVTDFKVTLTGTDVYGNQVELTTKTNENGEYLFDGVVPGKYVVTFDPAGLPAGHRFVAQGAGDDREKDSDGDAQTGATAEITLEPGAEIRSIDQGIEAIPADPTVPVDPAKPTDPAKPGEPAKPVEPAKPGDQPKQRLVVTGGVDPLLPLGGAAAALLLAAVLLVGAKLKRRVN